MNAGVFLLTVCLFMETWQRVGEAETKWKYNGLHKKAASDSYIGHDCLIAVSTSRLLMVKKQWRKIMGQHPLCYSSSGAVSDWKRFLCGLMDSRVGHHINTHSCKITQALNTLRLFLGMLTDWNFIALAQEPYRILNSLHAWRLREETAVC